jgi:hypothetical protein
MCHNTLVALESDLVRRNAFVELGIISRLYETYSVRSRRDRVIEPGLITVT